jgi:hypothetical protein
MEAPSGKVKFDYSTSREAGALRKAIDAKQRISQSRRHGAAREGVENEENDFAQVMVVDTRVGGAEALTCKNMSGGAGSRRSRLPQSAGLGDNQRA